MHAAVDADDLDEVKRLVHSGEAGVGDFGAGGWSAVHWAIAHDRLCVVQWMVEVGGADVGASNAAGYTALMLAIVNGCTRIVSWLLRAGRAGITDSDAHGRTVWYNVKSFYETCDRTPMEKADLYSVLRCFGAPAPSPEAFVASTQGPYGVFAPAQGDMMLQTERAHAHPLLLRYRAHRLDVLGSDCTRMLIPDLQRIVLEYLSDSLVEYLSEQELLSAGVNAEAAAAEEWGRTRGPTHTA
jgi:hypothetical protein